MGLAVVNFKRLHIVLVNYRVENGLNNGFFSICYVNAKDYQYMGIIVRSGSVENRAFERYSILRKM